jgi:AGCS family alanine or glycine:cation symporter
MSLSKILTSIDDFVWGPAMLVLLVGTGIFLTLRFRFLPWRNLFPSLKRLLSPESRKKSGSGDISPFSALMTALAATIGTGNIVGVATAMVAGGPGALVWMWISAAFGITTKFSECALAIKYREVNENGEMSGGPMYTIRKAFKCKPIGIILAFLFAVFAVLASFGIGNLTQANSISDALHTTFSIPAWVTGILLVALTLLILIGGIQRISKVSSILVPAMALFYILCGIIVIFGNLSNIPDGIKMIFSMAFGVRPVIGGLCGTITASMMNAMRYGVARGCFSNEAGMGSAAITAAAATTDNHVRQGYINMCGTFIDTIIVCTITGLAIASSGVLGTVTNDKVGSFQYDLSSINISVDGEETLQYTYSISDNTELVLTDDDDNSIVLTAAVENNGKVSTVDENDNDITNSSIIGSWTSSSGSVYTFESDGSYSYDKPVTGANLTILAFESVLGKFGAILVSVGLCLFAFSTILGWEYHGEKALEYLVKKPSICFVYRIIFALITYIGATTTLEIVWSFSDIANALMCIPNLISLLALSGALYKDMVEFREIQKQEKLAKQA